MSASQVITATFYLPSDMFVGTDGNHTTMPPGGSASLSFPIVSAQELLASPAIVQDRSQDMTSLLAVIAMSNQAYAGALSAVNVTVTTAPA